jgi:hypothetical protein
LMMIDDGLDDGVTARRQEARRQDPLTAHCARSAAELRRSHSRRMRRRWRLRFDELRLGE